MKSSTCPTTRICYKLSCQCDCDLIHKQCRQIMCDWNKERLLSKEGIMSKDDQWPQKPTDEIDVATASKLRDRIDELELVPYITRSQTI